jgi:hypothetical protein
MAKDGRITIVSDFRPRDLLDIAKEVAMEMGFGLDELDEDDDRKGFVARLAFVKRQNFVDHKVAEVEIEITADRTKRDDGRLTLDWVSVKEIWLWGGGGKPEKWARDLANAIEDAIEDDDGRVLSSEED